MREYISIVEARPRKPPMVDQTAQTQAVYDRALRVARAIGPNILYIQKWNQQWVGEIRNLAKVAQQGHAASEQETGEYEQENGRTYQARPFAITDYLHEVTAKWWDSIEPTIDQMLADAKYAYEEYQDDHPRVESSDTMSVHQGEVMMAQKIQYRGSDTLQGMDSILEAIDSFADVLNLYDFDRGNPCTHTSMIVITSIIPAIMAICQMRGAKRSG